MLRLPADLKERLVAEAKAAGRSMNAEITIKLRAAYGLPAEAEPGAQTSDMMREQTELLRRIAERLDAMDSTVGRSSPSRGPAKAA